MKWVLFDFDGTIADNAHLFFEGINALSQKYGYEKLNDFSKIKSLDSATSIQQELGVPKQDMKAFLKDIFVYANNQSNTIELKKGMKQLLITLKQQGFALAIISSNNKEFIETILQKHEIDSFFEEVIGQVSFSQKSQILLDFLKEKDVDIKDAVYVGDEIRDILACKEARIRIIAVAGGINTTEALSKHHPDHIATSTKELESLLLSNNHS